MDDEEDRKDLDRERLKTLAVGFAAFTMFMPIQLVTISSKHLSVALELKESFTGLYIAKLLSVKNLVLITCSIFMYILQYIIPGEDVVFTLFSHFLMVLSRLILFILLFTSSSLALDYYNCMAFISFTLGIFQMSFFSLTANYVTFLSATFKLSRLFAWLLQLFFDFLCKFFLQCSNYLRGDYNVLKLKYIGNFDDPREVVPTKEEHPPNVVRREEISSKKENSPKEVPSEARKMEFSPRNEVSPTNEMRKKANERSEVKMMNQVTREFSSEARKMENSSRKENSSRNEENSPNKVMMKNLPMNEVRRDVPSTTREKLRNNTSTRKNEVMTLRNKLKKSKGDDENRRSSFKRDEGSSERSEEEVRKKMEVKVVKTIFPPSKEVSTTKKNSRSPLYSENFPTTGNFLPSSKNFPRSSFHSEHPSSLRSSEIPSSLRSSGPPSTLIDIKESIEDDEPHFIRHLINSSSPMLLFITTTLLKCILLPGILPYSLIEREKCHFINMLMTPFALLSTLIVHYLKNKCPSIRKSWNHGKSIYWNLLWLAVLPVFIIFCITFISLHYTDTQLSKYIIGNLNAISFMVIIFYLSHPLVESAGFLGVTSNVRHNGRILKNGLKVVTTSQLISILIYLIGYKISIGYTITRRLYQQSIHNSDPTYHMNTFKSFFFWTFQSLSNGFNDFINEFHGNIKDYI